ncbi:MAG: protein kinase [Minicystis sp.]
MMGPAAGALPFEPLAEIAVGATARVDLCRVPPPHPQQGRLLAVKRLHPHIADDPTFVNQFLDEVWMTAALKHPNVVEVAGWGNDEEGSYLAVELVQGVSLFRLMKTIFDTGEAFTERMVVYLGACITRGLAVAHALRAPNGELLNLVHRNLTPGNVLLGFNGEVKIADFGMAKAKQRLTKTLTGMRKGEPTYMAPEAARADAIDARADLFSFGVMLFELFSGRRPWAGKTDIDMVQSTLRDPPADLRELRPKIDRELVNVVNRCLEKDPAARFQSAREITDRFDEWLHVHGYQEGNEEALARFVRRNAMRQMRWFERAIAGEMAPQKVGRDHPRVPTYTEHTQGGARASRSEIDAPRPPSIPLPPPPPGVIPPPPPPGLLSRPLVPPRGGNAPVDPRTLRAQAAVQQLKKLAPAVEPPRPKGRARVPALDDGDGDVTDVELRVAAMAQQGPPRITAADVDDEEETGEEIPTLVQRGDAQIMALRAEARKNEARKLQNRAPKPPYVSPGLIVDEESDQRITEVKKEQQRAAGPGVISIVDQDSELPTEPIQSKGKRPGDLPAPPAAGSRARTGAMRPPVIPPSPDIPPRPFPTAPMKPASALPPPPPPAPRSSPGPHVETQVTGAAPVVAARPASGPEPRPLAGSAPAAAAPVYDGSKSPGRPADSTASVSAASYDTSRVSQPDDVQVIDRDVLRQQVLHSEEGLVAESDRLAIEAVRRAEEARAAQLRAERKAAAARLAADAARIAAEAVQMIRTAGIAAAAKRLEEAHAIEQNMIAGRFPASQPGSGSSGAFSAPTPYAAVPEPPASDPSAVRSAPSQFPEPPRAVTFSGGFPGIDAARAMAITGGPVVPGSIPPPGPTSQVPPPPMSQPMAQSTYDTGRVSVPPSQMGSGPVSMPVPPSIPSVPPYAMAPQPAAAPAGVDADAFRDRLKPSILGMPSSLMVALAVGAVFLVIVLALLLAR